MLTLYCKISKRKVYSFYFQNIFDDIKANEYFCTMLNKIQSIIETSASIKQTLARDTTFHQQLANIADLWIDAFKQQGKVLFCGNGGSAADAQHLAAELSARFYLDRAPLFAEALHVNTSFLTAMANDYSYEEAFARMVYAAGKPGDILVAISTSGNSPNIIKAVEAAKEIGMIVIGFSGQSGGQLKSLCDQTICIPSTDTPRIQECHILAGHIICELVEQVLFAK